MPTRQVTQLEASRRRSGLTQSKLAELAGVSRETVSRLERGGAATLTTAAALADALGVSLDDIAGRTTTADAG